MYGKKLNKEPIKVKPSSVKLPNHQLVVESLEVNGRKVSRVVKSSYKPISKEIHAEAFSIDNYLKNNVPVHQMPKRSITPEAQISQLRSVLNTPKSNDNE